MSNPTLFTVCTGGGGVEAGAIDAGFEPIGGIEFNPSNPKQSWLIADCYEQNFGTHLIRKSVQQCWLDGDFPNLQAPDWLHASLPCTEFSVANHKGKETDSSISAAAATCEAIREWRSPIFTSENVASWEKSESWKLIENVLYECGYSVDARVLNMADYGIPQTRKRFIVRAVLGHELPLLPPKSPYWRGWYDAISDLELPESTLADWQLKRLPEDLKKFFTGKDCSNILNPSKNSNGDSSLSLGAKNQPSLTVTASINRGYPKVLVDCQSTRRDLTCRDASLPAFTVTSNLCSNPSHRPTLIERVGARDGIKTREANEPSWTIKAGICTDQRGGNRSEPINAFIDYKIYKLTTRALARLQGFPDWYKLPESNAIAGAIIGNAVPPHFAAQLGRTFYPLLKAFDFAL